MDEIVKDTPIGGENHEKFLPPHIEKSREQTKALGDLGAQFPRLAEAIANAASHPAQVAEELKSPLGDLWAGTNLRDQIIEAIKTVYDPEIPVNIYELGLIYEVNIGENGNIDVLMTLTSPGCPAAGMLPGDVEEKVRSVEGVGNVKVEVTFDPPWDQSMMTDEAKLELGFL